MENLSESTKGNNANTLLANDIDGVILIPKPEYAHIYQPNVEYLLKLNKPISKIVGKFENDKFIIDDYWMVKP
jgi:hypothetical protein